MACKAKRWQARPGQRLQVGGGDRSAVILDAPRLPHGDRLDEFGALRRPGAKFEDNAAPMGRVELRLAALAARRGGKHEVLRGAAETSEEMMVVGIDDRRASREIRQHRDAPTAKAEAPGLGIVAVRGQRRVADEIQGIRRSRSFARTAATAASYSAEPVRTNSNATAPPAAASTAAPIRTCRLVMALSGLLWRI